jgi:hypothetical protein
VSVTARSATSRSPAPPPPWRRTGPLGRCHYVHYTGESWRPKIGAARTKVATTPARIADGGAPATKMYSHIRPRVAWLRISIGTTKRRRTTRSWQPTPRRADYLSPERAYYFQNTHSPTPQVRVLLIDGAREVLFERVGKTCSGFHNY